MTGQPDPGLIARVRQRIAAEQPWTVRGAGGRPAEAAVRASVAAALVAEGVDAGPGGLARMVRDVTDHVAGLGPLQQLLRSPGVTDVLVNGPTEVVVERHGRLEPTDVVFPDDDAVLEAVRRVLGPTGGRIDRGHPFADARLPDGSRLHAVGPPVVDAPLVTLRRFDARTPTWAALAADGAVPVDAAEQLRAAVAARTAIAVCGRTGTGKTTLLGRLLSDVGADQRVVLIEDAPELRPATPHLVRMRTRPPGIEGAGGIDVAALVRQALRMRPDRIVVGEVRGVEVADVLQALITGHEGCMTTVHARTAAQALIRLEGMALQAGLPLEAARAQLGSALDMLVVLDRSPGGGRGVTEIAEVSLRGRAPVATVTWRRGTW